MLRSVANNEAGSANRALEQILIPHSWCGRSLMCMEGQAATGLFVLRSGRAKESLVSREGKIVILRILGPGDSIGLYEILSGAHHDTTVETLEPVEAGFVHSEAVLGVLRKSEALGVWVARQLSNKCHDMYQQIRRLGLYGNIPQSMAGLILQWLKNPVFGPRQEQQSRLRIFLTHEEIGQVLGCTRETVSRVLGTFQKNGWIKIKGGVWEIRDRSALDEIKAEPLASPLAASTALDTLICEGLSGRNTTVN